MPTSADNPKIYMGPKEVGAPDQLDDAIIGFIDGANKKGHVLLIAVQELEHEGITQAILRAKAKGATVKIVLEGDYLREGEGRADPQMPGGGKEPNRKMLNALFRAGIEVRTDYNPNIFHQKFIVRQRSNSDWALLTGSTNFTPTGCHNNLNHVVTLMGKSVTLPYWEEFEEIWGGTFGAKRLRHDPKPKEGRISGVNYKLLFAPDHSPEMEIMKQMLKAQSSIHFAVFTFAQSSGIDDTMLALNKAGITIKGVVEHKQGSQQWAATKPLVKAGIDLRSVPAKTQPNGNRLGKLHHKLMVIDQRVVIGGSFNYTAPANRLNDENVFILGDLEDNDPTRKAAEQKLAAYALKEINRIYTTHGIPISA